MWDLSGFFLPKCYFSVTAGKRKGSKYVPGTGIFLSVSKYIQKDEIPFFILWKLKTKGLAEQTSSLPKTQQTPNSIQHW